MCVTSTRAEHVYYETTRRGWQWEPWASRTPEEPYNCSVPYLGALLRRQLVAEQQPGAGATTQMREVEKGFLLCPTSEMCRGVHVEDAAHGPAVDEEVARTMFRRAVDPCQAVAGLPLGADDAAEEIGDDVEGEEGEAVPAKLP